MKNLTKESRQQAAFQNWSLVYCESSRSALPSVASGPPYYYGPASRLICLHETGVALDSPLMSGPTLEDHQARHASDCASAGAVKRWLEQGCACIKKRRRRARNPLSRRPLVSDWGSEIPVSGYL